MLKLETTTTNTKKVRIGIATREILERAGQKHFRPTQETHLFIGLTENQFNKEYADLSHGKRKPYDLIFWNGQKGKIVELLQQKHTSDAEKALIIAVRDHFPELFNTCIDSLYLVS